MAAPTAKLGMRVLVRPPPSMLMVRSHTFCISSIPTSCHRGISSSAIINTTCLRKTSVKNPKLGATPPTTTSTPSSFFTPSLCRIRNASTTATASTASTGPTTQATASTILDWNSFFSLRTSRRRYSLTSSILAAIASTGGAFYFMVEFPEVADQVTKLIPTDPFISMGIATFGATFLGWLIGPIFGNAIWRLLHRSRVPEFTIKEKAFFERIKKHRVNPSGASTNNPVPDFYGEKVGSVSGYRRWLKDQRAFNRKRGGNYPVPTR